jgi:hypothetical protein
MRATSILFLVFWVLGTHSFSPAPFLVAPSSTIKKKNVPNQGKNRDSSQLADATSAVVPAPVGGGGTATISNEIFNLVKAIVGAGVLSLPAGKFHFFYGDKWP